MFPLAPFVPGLLPKFGAAFWVVSALALVGIGLVGALARLERADDI
jgi:hypothetical protein